jgi:hypothetical protein
MYAFSVNNKHRTRANSILCTNVRRMKQLMVMFAVAMLSIIPVRASAAPVVSLLPSISTAYPGDSVTLSVIVNMNETNLLLGAYSFEIIWNAAVCTYDSAVGGSNQYYATLNSHSDPGLIKINQFSTHGADGVIEVARLTFTVTGSPGNTVVWSVVVKNIVSTASTGDFVNLLSSTTTMPGTLRIFGKRALAGTVIGLNTGLPIPGASVLVSPGSFSATTAQDGSYIISGIPADSTLSYAVLVNVNNYQPFTETIASFPYFGATYALSLGLAETTAPRVTPPVTVPEPYKVADQPESLSVSVTVSIDTVFRMTAWSAGSTASLSIAAAEAYIDSDPGIGRGYAVHAEDGAFDEAVETVTGVFDITALSKGGHDIYVRALNSQNQWGYPAHTDFVKGSELSAPAQFTALERQNSPSRIFDLAWSLSVSEQNGTVRWYRLFRSRQSTFGQVVSLASVGSETELLTTEQHATILIDSVAVGSGRYTDDLVKTSMVPYYYWIQTIGENDASYVRSTGLSPFVEGSPDPFTLVRVFPNPFNGTTQISFVTKESCQTTVQVYDVTGRKISTLVNDYLSAGSHSVFWNGRDDDGCPVSSGVYLYNLIGGQQRRIGKMMLVK